MEQIKRVALVTGAASGIGKAIAERLNSNGVQVVGADVDEAIEELAKEAGLSGVVCDLSQREECRRLADEVISRHQRIDILINNAGFQHVASIDSFPEDTWDQMLAVLLTAPFLLTRYLWPAMKKQGFGRIINIGSIHSLVASPFKCGYVAAKHGLLGLTRVAALEGGESGITVNAICPAYVQTPLVDRQIEDQSRALGIPPEQVISTVMLQPAAIKRLIHPDEIAGLVSYLCSDAAGSITGAAWTVDLGWTSR
ncbi:MAG TPA: 3-hydroxybutyrate dehydrogenase [Acidobacteriota bacterium]|nr:3-hydroxybutyrate dehydrogenase [Acidobacteriota bacterium]